MSGSPKEPLWDATHIPMLDGKLVVVTGASSGIGICIARQLASHNAHVVLADCNVEGGERVEKELREAGNPNVEFMQIDLGSQESIRAFSEKLHAKSTSLDVLINNAGILLSPNETTKDGFELHFGVNYLGHFYLTSLLFDMLKASKEARIVNISSVMHRNRTADFSTIGYKTPGMGYMNEYGISKLAVLLSTFELHRRLQAAGLHNVKVIASHPGGASTNMKHIPEWQVTLVAKFLLGWIIQTPEKAALPTLRAATDASVESGEFYGPRGLYQMKGHPVRVEASKESHSQEDAAKLWKRSEELLHCRFDVN